MKQSAAQAKATANWEKRNYWRVLVRFRKEDESRVRSAAGESLNSFIVNAVLEAAGSENAHENSDGVKWFAFPADMIAEMQQYGDPTEMLFDGAMAMISEYRAGLR